MLDVRALASGYQKIPIILGVTFQVADGEFVGFRRYDLAGDIDARHDRIVAHDTAFRRQR